MSRMDFEREMAAFIDAALSEAEAKIASRYPGAFDGYPAVDSLVGVTEQCHVARRREYGAALAAGVRWSVWISEEVDCGRP